MSKFTSITLPMELADKIKKRLEGTGFTSLSSYVKFVLREILGHDEDLEEEEEALSKFEKEELLKRLRNLGYI